jgi:hypothetical protein
MEHVLSVSLVIISLMEVLVRCVIIIHVVLAGARHLMLNTAHLAMQITLDVPLVCLDSTRMLMVFVLAAISLTVLNVV